MFVYGVLRWVDGRDGQRKDDAAWDVGHIAFFIAIALFAVLAFQLRRLVHREWPTRGVTADLATVATVIGAGCFLWVIAGDLSTSFADAAPLPDILQALGPMLFQVGLLVLLVLLLVGRRIPWWSPLLVVLGFAAVAVSLDLLTVSAILVGAGLTPLARPGFARHAEPAGRRVP